LDSVVAFRAKKKHPLESKGYSLSFEADLQEDELLTSVVSVTVSGPPDDETPLIAGYGTVNAATILDDEGNPIAAGLAAQFQASAGTDGFDYRVTITATTNVMGPGNTYNVTTGVCVFQVRAGIP
jgi:hypothetical protein